MQDENRFRPKPSQLIIHRGQSFLITDLTGMAGTGGEGFFFRQTRFLSRLRLELDGKTPRAVSANSVGPDTAIAYYLGESPAGPAAGPDPDAGKSGEMVEHAIEVQVNRTIGGGLRQRVTLTNHGLAPAAVVLGLDFDADFVDLDEAGQDRRKQNAPVGRRWQARPGGAELVFRYGHPRLAHSTEIRLAGKCGFELGDGRVQCRFDLEPQQPASLDLEVSPVFLGDRIPASSGPAAADDRSEGMRLTTANRQVQHAWDRAIADLASLPLGEGDGVERETPAAGIPKYVALFGRDALMTSLQAGLVRISALRGSLSLLARWAADKYEDRFDAQPGRILHQRQQGPLALLGENPFLHYYGDYSAPGLFVIDAAWHLALTGDAEFFGALRDKLLRALEWIDRDGDSDGDGFYEYATKAGQQGIKNQGWKDSDDAVLYENGRIVPNPVAISEIQGCFYAAKQAAALAFALLGEPARAADLLSQAEKLKRRFNNTFWVADENYFALALDPDKKPVRTIAADAGQCLAYGIVDDDKAAAVADRLMQPDLFSGWGLRTLSSRHPAYNPFGYHLGSVWPTANAIIGFGMKRYGFDAQLHRLAGGMFDASRLFEYDRLPEAMGGQPRDADHPHPGIYPDANSPQAWSASAVVFLVQTMAGLLPMAPRRTLIIDPALPEWLPEMTLTDIRIGAARIGLRFRRDRSGHTDCEIIDRDGDVRLYRPQTARPAGSERLSRLIREVDGS